MHNSVLYYLPVKGLISHLWPDMLSTNQIALLFDNQYFLKESIHTSILFAWI